MALDVLRALIGLPRQAHNASIAAQNGFAVDTYLVGSNVAIPAGLLQARSKYRCRFNVVKTAAGVVAPIINVRVGIAASVADVSRAVLAFATQTAVVDEGVYDVEVVFRSVGAVAAAIIAALGQLTHRLSVTGLSTEVAGAKVAVSAGFDSTVAGLQIGLSVNAGASAAWTVTLVSAELVNLK